MKAWLLVVVHQKQLHIQTLIFFNLGLTTMTGTHGIEFLLLFLRAISIQAMEQHKKASEFFKRVEEDEQEKKKELEKVFLHYLLINSKRKKRKR